MFVESIMRNINICEKHQESKDDWIDEWINKWMKMCWAGRGMESWTGEFMKIYLLLGMSWYLFKEDFQVQQQILRLEFNKSIPRLTKLSNDTSQSKPQIPLLTVTPIQQMDNDKAKDRNQLVLQKLWKWFTWRKQSIWKATIN